MPIERPAAPLLPESIGPGIQPSNAGEVKPLEQKVGKAAEGIGGVLPEAPPPLLTQRQITELSTIVLPKDLPAERVGAALTSIMEEKGISSEANIGIETVAAQRFNKEMNVLLEVRGYPPLLPEYDVQSVQGVDIIVTEAGATVTGSEAELSPAFLEEVPEIAAFAKEGKVAIVSKEMVGEIKELTDDRFSEIATELRDRTEGKEPFEIQESVEAKEASSAEEVEVEEGEGAETTEADSVESEKEAQVEEPEKTEEGAAAEEETEEHHPAEPITRNTVEAALVGKVAERILHRVVASGIWGAHTKVERHRQKVIAKESQERKETEKEERKKEDRKKDILKEEVASYEEKRDIEKSDALKSSLTSKTHVREKGRQQGRKAIGEAQEKKKVGERVTPPSIPSS